MHAEFRPAGIEGFLHNTLSADRLPRPHQSSEALMRARMTHTQAQICALSKDAA